MYCSHEDVISWGTTSQFYERTIAFVFYRFFAVLHLSTWHITRSGMRMIQHLFGKILNEVPQRSSGGAALDLWEEGRFTKDFKLAPTVSTHHFLIKCHWQTLIYSWHDQDMWDSTPHPPQHAYSEMTAVSTNKRQKAFLIIFAGTLFSSLLMRNILRRCIFFASY